MAKWRHMRMSAYQERINIFPASSSDLNWVFSQFPKTKRSRESDNSQLIIEVQEKEVHIVEEAILHFLEENGWEAYASEASWGFTAFKRKVE